MKHDELHHAMSSVVEDMGRAAKGAKMKRFAAKKKHSDSMKLPPMPGHDAEVDPVKEAEMDPNEMAELESALGR
jgi:hypothetical protein